MRHGRWRTRVRSDRLLFLVLGGLLGVILSGVLPGPTVSDVAAAREEGEVTEQEVPRPTMTFWEINAKAAEPLVEFYTQLFGWESAYDEQIGIWRLDSGDTERGGIPGAIFTGKGALPTHRCLYISVADVDAFTARAKALGREILQGPFNLNDRMRLAFFEDPEGHMLGLIGPAVAEGG